jgi:hypothetical protein
MRETPKNPSEFQWLPPLQGDPSCTVAVFGEGASATRDTPLQILIRQTTTCEDFLGPEAPLTISATLHPRHSLPPRRQGRHLFIS